MLTLETMLRLGGILHFGILCAALLVPVVLDWRARLSKLDPFMRQLVWVYGVFIALVIVGFGTLSLVYTHALAGGTPLARGICAFVALFWLARLAVQMFVFNVGRITSTQLLKLGYHGLTVVFIYLTVVYGLAAAVPLVWLGGL